MRFSSFLKDIPSFLSFTPLGLDLGSFSVKLVQIKKSGFSKERLISFAVVPLKSQDSQEALREAIRQACQELAPDSNKVNISVCGPNVIMRYIILPSMQAQDLTQSLEFELERYIPLKREDAIVDSQILTKLPNNQMIVLLVAVEKRFIQERIQLIKDAGLEPLLINVDAFALMEAFKAVSPVTKGVSGLLDIGYHLSKLVVFESNVPYFSRDIEIGEYEIFQMVSEKLDLDFNLVKKLSYQPEGDKPKEIAEAAKPILNSLLSELSLSFEYCERDLEKKVEQLYLSGGGINIKFLLETLGDIPDLKLSLWNPAQGFKFVPLAAAKDLKEYAHLLAVAIGLALC